MQPLARFALSPRPRSARTTRAPDRAAASVAQRSVLAVCLLAATATGQVLVADDFSGPSLDPTKWTALPSTVSPGPSAVFVQGGKCVLQNRGHLVTAQQFDPNTAGPLRIAGSFQLNDAYDFLTIVTRSDGVPAAPYGNTVTGFHAEVWGEGVGPYISMGGGGGVTTPLTTTVAGADFQPQPGLTYTFELIDSGSTVSLTVSGQGQSVTLSATVLSDTTTSKFIEFYNRENFLGPHQMFLDDLVIEATHLAAYSPFGTGCPDPNGAVPALSAVGAGVPRIGTTSLLRVANLPTVVCVPIYAFGFSDSSDIGPGGSYALPLDLGLLGWTGCQQLVSLNILEYAITVTGAVDHPLVLPYEPAWVGVRFFVQSVVLYHPSGVAVTGALSGVVGY